MKLIRIQDKEGIGPVRRKDDIQGENGIISKIYKRMNSHMSPPWVLGVVNDLENDRYAFPNWNVFRSYIQNLNELVDLQASGYLVVVVDVSDSHANVIADDQVVFDKRAANITVLAIEDMIEEHWLSGEPILKSELI